MPQFTEFLPLPPGDVDRAAAALLSVLRGLPAEGEPFRAFRQRLKAADLWSRERLPQFLRFLQMAQEDPIRPSPLVRAVAAADDAGARELLANRLWAVNPLLFATIWARLEERVHSPNELLKFVDSFAYPGARINGPAVRAWIRLGQALGLFRLVGIRLALTDRARAWFGKRIGQFDVEEFIEEDVEEPEIEATPPAAAPEPSPPPAAPARPPPPAATEAPAVTLPSPLGRGRPVSLRRFGATGPFSDDVRAITVERLSGWWAEQEAPPALPGPEAFELDAAAFQEDPEGAIFRLAVGAALLFGDAPADATATWRALSESGALDTLAAGTRHDGPVPVRAQALLDASVVARRVAEHPELAADLERASDAEAAFTLLEGAFGRGLFGLELFWMMRALATLGVIRRDGVAEFAALPDRRVRDTLYRLGFLDTPYARDTEALRAAASAAGAFGAGAHHLLNGFADAAGCQYSCPHRQRCDLPCRERADQG